MLGDLARGRRRRSDPKSGDGSGSSAARTPAKVVVLGRSEAPTDHVMKRLGPTDKYLGLGDVSIADPHARILVYGKERIEIEPLDDADVVLVEGDVERDVTTRTPIEFSGTFRLGSLDCTVRDVLERSLRARQRPGLRNMVGDGTHVIRDYGEVKGTYDVLDEVSLELELRTSEREVLAIARPHGASSDRLSIFYDSQRHQLALPRIKDLEHAGYTVDRIPASGDVVQQIRQDLDAQQSDANSEENSHLYNEFRSYTARAIAQDASDIHIEVRDQRAWMRFRVHGELETQAEFSPKYALRLCRAVYNQAVEGGGSAFNVGQKQAGQIEDTFESRQAGLRVQTLPCTPRGSFDLTARILLYDIEGQILEFEDMGYHATQAKQIRRATARPQGATVIAGTTGSGKSTTLDNAIRGRVEFYQGTKKIITVEEPVERRIPGTTQVEINRAADEGNEDERSDFAQSITAAMRADPDLLMVQEVRDADTAKLFSRATLSGHAVYTTTHTGNPFEVVSRFGDLGIPEHILQSHGFLNALIHQALTPIHCPQCAITLDDFRRQAGEREVFRQFTDRVEVFFGALAEGLTFRGAGCEHCKDSGKVGREVCAEVVEIHSDKMRQKLIPGRLSEAREQWLAEGNLTAFAHGVLKVMEGRLSPRELEGLIDTIPEMSLEEYFGEGHIVTERYRELIQEASRA